ncbi:hypothetical protein KHM83_10640 [Fusibacter paucivorans]|uniref:Sigma-70, region 4 n=1 Tax=Fusibacter paucivorans TaxID=76009 RepID=A0ABS5PRZ3_9FIRM|nr:hypothetical protein [Fusibacter paucivorans]MBS7527136.1 hypothetical protein [Fusibacter paucivorans]
MANKWETAINYGLNTILEEAVFDERSELIFKKYYGIHCERKTPKEIAKLTKMPIKKLKLEMTKIDNKVFNILKKNDLWIASEDAMSSGDDRSDEQM